MTQRIVLAFLFARVRRFVRFLGVQRFLAFSARPGQRLEENDMSTGLGRIVALALVGGSLIGFTGCGAKTLGRSTLTTTIGTRKVTASLDGAGFISSQGDAAVISFSGGKLVVGKDSVQLDGKQLATFSDDANEVQVDYTAGKLTITADGSSVLSTELPE